MSAAEKLKALPQGEVTKVVVFYKCDDGMNRYQELPGASYPQIVALVQAAEATVAYVKEPLQLEVALAALDEALS